MRNTVGYIPEEGQIGEKALHTGNTCKTAGLDLGFTHCSQRTHHSRVILSRHYHEGKTTHDPGSNPCAGIVSKPVSLCLASALPVWSHERLYTNRASRDSALSPKTARLHGDYLTSRDL
ncbi:hypothetical protein BaRGS_00037797 [Batillaria attramentaria]|uniref:Uncharacterized protein n=1 Tax=Batillaria attramentaria TaxID=370345 RepID=A0ABD0J937_9CAEN